MDAINNGTKPVLSMERQRHLVEMICAIATSIETGKTVDLHTTF